MTGKELIARIRHLKGDLYADVHGVHDTYLIRVYKNDVIEQMGHLGNQESYLEIIKTDGGVNLLSRAESLV